MAIKYESALKWGETFYLKSDPEQAEYNLISILLTPGRSLLKLRHNGYAVVTVYESETTRQPDMTKLLDLKKKQDSEDQEEEDDDTPT